MRHGSLFSGIGGFDLVAEWMGWENVFHCELNEFCQNVLGCYWPDAEQFTDITKSDFTKYANRIDILTGGFPCQPYSTAGKRLGKEDERHLWAEMLRAIREIKPRWVVGENVSGHISWNGGMVFEEVQADLEAEGYEVIPFVLPACGVNAPHRRDRVWFIAHDRHSQCTGLEGGGREREGFKPGCEENGGVAKNTHEDGRGCNEWESQSGIRGFWEAGTGDHEWVHQQPDAWVAPDTEGLRINREKEYENGDRQGGERWRRNIDDIGEVSEWEAAPHPVGIGQQRQGRDAQSGNPEAGSDGQTDWFNNGDERWERFPTQSPVCSRDDGIPGRLDGITVSKWRKESIKAYGNAVVPQVVYQIFKAIQSYDTTETIS